MIWVGTSGYNYPEWKGTFYPADLPAAKMLPYYAARFPTVEINYTFYRMPNEKIVSGWAAQTPSPFKLTLKAPRRITHDNRLKNCGELVAAFCGVAGSLQDKLGALLFQLPPNARKDLPLLDAFLAELPPNVRAAFEFRHVSWLDDEVCGRLAARNLALCVADSERLATPGSHHGRLRVLPAARRGLHRARHRALGGHHRPRRRRLPRRVRVLQARRGRERAGVRPAAHGTPGNREIRIEN